MWCDARWQTSIRRRAVAWLCRHLRATILGNVAVELTAQTVEVHLCSLIRPQPVQLSASTFVHRRRNAWFRSAPDPRVLLSCYCRHCWCRAAFSSVVAAARCRRAVDERETWWILQMRANDKGLFNDSINIICFRKFTARELSRKFIIYTNNQ